MPGTLKNILIAHIYAVTIIISTGCAQTGGTGAFNLGSGGNPGGPAFNIYFSPAGSILGKSCIQLVEPSDSNFGASNFLCTDVDLGLKWSNAGPYNNMFCIPFDEPGEPLASTWVDNYLCSPNDIGLRFSYRGPIAGMACTQINVGDTDFWSDNYLCVPENGNPPASAPNTLYYNSTGSLASKNCIQIVEPADPNWGPNNYLCSDKALGLQWSNAGPITGQTCTAITEPGEPATSTWTDNYVCAPTDIGLKWSNTGALAGMQCLPFGGQDPDGWSNNFLCYPVP